LTINMGRNRLNSIENWIKPPKPPKSRRQAESAAAGLHPAAETKAAAGSGAAPVTNSPPAPGSIAAPRPVSQFIRTSVLAARR
jgi:hypothetical protein